MMVWWVWGSPGLSLSLDFKDKESWIILETVETRTLILDNLDNLTDDSDPPSAMHYSVQLTCWANVHK